MHALLLLLACRDPVLREIDRIALPEVARAEPPAAAAVVAITRDAVLLDPTPVLPDAAPARILGLADPQTHELALPALVAALEPVRDAREEELPVALAADADVPYEVVARVIYSLGMAAVADVELRVRTPAGPGAVPLPFPRYCGAAPAEVTDPCLQVTVSEAADGLRVVADEVDRARHGCGPVVRLAGPHAPPAVATDWRGAVLVPAAGACPSVPGRDLAALRALLARTEALGTPCADAVVAPAASTRWGDALALLLAVRERHPDALLGLDRAEPSCAPAWTLGG